MRRILTLCVVLGVAAGCQRSMGYRRPVARDTDAIGSPAVGVGSNGLEHGPSDPHTPSVATEPFRPPEKFTESGQIASSDIGTVTLKRPTGEEILLGVRPLTSIMVDGQPATARALPEGAEARASYVIDGSQKVAERIEVKTSKKARAGKHSGSGS